MSPLDETRSLLLMSSPQRAKVRIASQRGQAVYQRAMVHCQPCGTEDTYLLVVQAIAEGTLRTIVSLDLRECENIIMRNRSSRLFTVGYR